MNGLLAVQSRIAELQGRIEQLAPARTTTATPVSGLQFAGALTSALGSTGVQGAGSLQQEPSAIGATAASRDSAAAVGPSSGAGISAAVRRYEPLFAQATAKYGLPQGLLAAVAQVESAGNPSAVSRAGAQGLMQLMPATAKGLGVDALDPAQAVDGAARLLKGHLGSFGSLDLALAAYNAGPGAVRRYDGVPPYAETQSYVRKVGALLGGAR